MIKNKKNIIIGIILGISIALFTIIITQKLIFKKNKIDNNTIKENEIEENNYQEENIIEKEEIKNNEKTTTSIKKNNNSNQNNKPKTNNNNNSNQNNNQNENSNNDNNNENLTDNNNEFNNTNENTNQNNENDNENTNNNENNNTLTIDLYYSETCPHCHAFMEYYDTLDENIKSKIIFNKYEISTMENINNIVKYLDVSKKINSTCGGVPFIVFNEEDYMCGFADSLIETFLEKLRHYGIIN